MFWSCHKVFEPKLNKIDLSQQYHLSNLYLYFSAKIRNIEATEEAKLKLLWERHSKKDGPSHFVPTNMAVNFVQHNRCKFLHMIMFPQILEFFIQFCGC